MEATLVAGFVAANLSPLVPCCWDNLVADDDSILAYSYF